MESNQDLPRPKPSEKDNSASAQRNDAEAANSSAKRKRNRRKKKVNQGTVQGEQAAGKGEDHPSPTPVSSTSVSSPQEDNSVKSSEDHMSCSTPSSVTNSQPSDKRNKKRKSGGVDKAETIVSPSVQKSISNQVSVSVPQNTNTSAGALHVAEFGVFNSKDLELIRTAGSLGPIYSASSFHCGVTVTCSSASSQLSNQRIESSHLYGGTSFSTTSPIVAPQPTEKMSAPPVVQKSREEVEAERKARKAAKAAAKGKPKGNEKESVPTKPPSKEPNTSNKNEAASKAAPTSGPVDQKAAKGAVEKLTENVKALSVTDAKQAPKQRAPDEPDFARSTSFAAPIPVEDVIPAALKQMMTKEGAEKSKAELRAERRAKQEAQRAAKTQQQVEKTKAPQESQQKATPSGKPAPKDSNVKGPEKPTPSTKLVKEVKEIKAERRVKLFSHLYQNSFKNISHTIGVSHPQYHLSIVRLGVQYANRVVLGSNARCLALLYSLKDLIADYETPPQKEFSRGLEAYLQPNMDFLQKCRPHSVSMINALRYIKWQLTQISIEKSDREARQHILEAIDQYINDQIEKAAEAIGKVVKDKIDDNDVILVYACSSLVLSALKVALDANRKFHVIVVDSLPWLEGREMLRRLVSMGVQCSYVHLSAASFVMRKVSKVLLGAHALLANGYVMSRAGSSQVALLAHANNVPVLVCCETHKFSERVQTDSFVYNELADPDELIGTKRAGERETESERPLANWRDIPSLSLLNLVYDVTPPDLVTAVVTERAILPCTSVPVILRIKPTEC